MHQIRTRSQTRRTTTASLPQIGFGAAGLSGGEEVETARRVAEIRRGSQSIEEDNQSRAFDRSSSAVTVVGRGFHWLGR